MFSRAPKNHGEREASPPTPLRSCRRLQASGPLGPTWASVLSSQDFLRKPKPLCWTWIFGVDLPACLAQSAFFLACQGGAGSNSLSLRLQLSESYLRASQFPLILGRSVPWLSSSPIGLTLFPRGNLLKQARALIGERGWTALARWARLIPLMGGWALPSPFQSLMKPGLCRLAD